MNRDPLGLGRMLYGFRPQPHGVGTLLAAGAHFMTLIPDGHGGCGISTFCKNPLHPGPCKGWKKGLAKNAPGALHAIEKAHAEKVAAKRVARNEAKSAASKKLTNRQLESPLHSKKATIKAANELLGDDTAKAGKKADRVILNKAEIKKYSKIKAAQMNAMRTKHGLTEDTGLEDRIAAALAEDNKTGKDTKYRETIAVSGDSLGAQLAQKHCAKGDGDCDGKPYEWLRDEASGYAEQALLTGDDSDLDTFLKDYDAGKAKPPAEPKPAPKAAGPDQDPTKAAIDYAKAADGPGAESKKFVAVNGMTKEQYDALGAEDKKWVDDALAEIANSGFGDWTQSDKKAIKATAKALGVKIPAKKKEPAPGPAPESDAGKAQKGMEFGLGLLAFAKGNKTLGTKAKQKDFADKLEKSIGSDDENGVIKAGAEVIASSLVTHAQKSKGVFGPSVSLGKNEENKIKEMLQAELEDGLKGGDGPKPVLASVKKAVTAAQAGDPDGVKEAKAELNDHIKTAAATKLGLDPNASANVVAAHILFKPNSNLADGKSAVRMKVLDGMSKEEFDGLPPGVKKTAADWLNDRADHFNEEGPDGAPEVAAVVAIQQKMGLPEFQPTSTAPAGPDLSIFDGDAVSDMTKTDALHQLDGDAFDELPIATQTKIANFLNAEEQAYFVGSDSHNDVMSLKAKFGLPATPASWQGIAVTPMTDATTPAAPNVLDNLLNGTYKPDPKDVFGPDGNPDHELAVSTVADMTPADWKGLSEDEKLNVMDHITDAMSNGEPGSSQAMDKVVGFFEADKPPAPPTVAAPAVVLSPAGQKAFDFATGAKSGTMTKKFEAYQDLEGEEFGAMAPEVQALILADLKAAKSKFVNPAKKQMVQSNIDFLTPFAGGGAGAGGAPDTTNPAAPSGADKIHDGADWSSKFVQLLPIVGGPKPGKPDEVYASMLAMLQMAEGNGTKKTVVDSMGDIWAGEALKKLNAMHADPIGNDFILPDEIAEMKPALAADIAKKFGGEPGPTPVLDAWTKAISLGALDDAQAFLDAAAPGGGAGGSDAGSSPSPAMITAKQNQVAALWLESGNGVKPKAAPNDGLIAAKVAEAMVTGVTDQHAKDEGAMMAAGVMGTVSTMAGVPPLPGNPADFTKIMSSLEGEFEQAIKSGHFTLPSESVTKQLHGIADDVAQQGLLLAEKNGWAEDSDTVKNYKKALMEAKLAELADKLAPAYVPPSVNALAPSGPAGTSVNSPAPSGPSLATPPKPTNVTIGTGTDISGISETTQKEMWDELKAFPSGKFLSDPKDETYKNLLGLAAAYGTADKPLSVLQVLKSLDAAGSKANGWTNINKWENEFVDWLKTPAGSAFAKANPTADPKLVKKITGEFGEYEGITTDLVALSKKVPLLGGPGAFDPDKPSSDFKVMTPTQANAMRAKMLASNGGEYTQDEQAGIWVYTSNQYGSMNSWLRGETNTLSEARKKAIKQTQAAMRPVPQDLIVHRGTGWDALPEGFQSAAGAKALIGKTVMDEAFMSTSVGGGAAFGGAMLLELEVPKGTMAAYVDGKNKNGDKISTHPGEREMLLAAGQSYQIISVTKNGYQTVVRARIVTANAPTVA